MKLVHVRKAEDQRIYAHAWHQGGTKAQSCGGDWIGPSQEMASVVKCLMEGQEGKKLHYRIKDLKEVAAKVLSPHGSSTDHISNLLLKWTNKPPSLLVTN